MEKTTIQTWMLRLTTGMIVLAQPFDVWTTNRALAGKAVELNPVMQFAMQQMGSFYWLPKLAVAVILVLLLYRLKRSTSVLVLAVISLIATGYTLAVLNNYFMLV